jgi:hypothetical protein
MVIDSVFRYFLSLCRKTHIHPHPDAFSLGILLFLDYTRKKSALRRKKYCSEEQESEVKNEDITQPKNI